jgi:2-polyprenyl-6-methoxyphenol hydroxylase-like FAD-dependent oxidoreductase
MLGLYDLLIEKCAHQQPYFNFGFGGFTRDLRITTPQKLPALTFYHAAMQEVVLEAARAAGAEVRRGVTVKNVTAGKRPSVSIEGKDETRELTARLVVCADGRSSAGRSWGEFAVKRGRQRLLGAGILLEDLAVPDDTSVSMMNPVIGRVAFLFPQGEGRVRAYLMYGEEEVGRLQGESAIGRFVAACAQTGIPAEAYAGARPAGPLASFDMTESWVEHPYREGLALIGDAAGSSDPTWGQGMSLTLRDARVLSSHLLTTDDWETAGNAYAIARARYFNAMITTEDWTFQLFIERGPLNDELRARAMPLIAADLTRVPDHGFSGPDLPFDETVRRRFFGED